MASDFARDTYIAGVPLQSIPQPGERLARLNRQFIYQKLKSGALKGVRVGDRTFITTGSLLALIAALQPYVAGGPTAAQAARMVEAKAVKKAATATGLLEAQRERKRRKAKGREAAKGVEPPPGHA